MTKAIYEATIPKELAIEYALDIKIRYQKMVSNESPMMIILYILRHKLLDMSQEDDLKDYLRNS